MMDWVSIIGSLVGGGGIGTVVTMYFTRNRVKAETVKIGAEARTLDVGAAVTLVSAWERLMGPLQGEVVRLNVEHHECEQRAKKLEKRIEELESIIRGVK